MIVKPAQIETHSEQSLLTLVENRTAYSYEACELNVFETHQKARDVRLVFNDFVLTSMLQGKKIMHLEGKEAFDYLPGESVIVGPNQAMEIDFPEAGKGSPTQCIALAISQPMIDFTLDLLNEKHPKVLETDRWQIDLSSHHIINNHELVSTINRIIQISTKEQGAAKDIFVELALKEMIIRLMQTQARELFTSGYQRLASSDPLACAIQFIKENIHQKIDFNQLAKMACMSRANFFKKFKENFGITPGQFILKERIRLAKKWLADRNTTISEACYNAGFENLSHFTSAFKKDTGMSPSQYKKQRIFT